MGSFNETQCSSINDKEYILHSLITITPSFLIFINFILFCIIIMMGRSHTIDWGIYFSLCLCILIGCVGPQLFKWLIGKLMHKNKKFINRPPKAGECFTCGPVLSYNISNKSFNNSIGMPSGHCFQSTFLSFLTIYQICLCVYLLRFDKKKNIDFKLENIIMNNSKIFLYVSLLISIAYISLTAWSRIKLNCHTWPQCIVGFILGLLITIVIIFLLYNTTKSIQVTDFNT